VSLPRDFSQCHVRIGRLVVDAPPGTDRAALARELAGALPAALGERLAGGTTAAPAGTPTLAQQVAAAVAARLRGGSR